MRHGKPRLLILNKIKLKPTLLDSFCKSLYEFIRRYHETKTKRIIFAKAKPKMRNAMTTLAPATNNSG